MVPPAVAFGSHEPDSFSHTAPQVLNRGARGTSARHTNTNTHTTDKEPNMQLTLTPREPLITVMPDTDYFTIDSIDQTMLKHFMVSPRDYAYHRLNPPADDLPAFAVGKAAHSLTLGSGPEPTLKPNLRTKDGKAKYEAMRQDGIDRVWLTAADIDLVTAMCANRPDYFDLHPGTPERAMFATLDGVPCKGKADWLPDGPDDDGVYRIVDYKTVRGNPADFPRDAYSHGYDIQAAFYMRLYAEITGETNLGFTFVVQSKQPPYDWQVWRFDADQPEILTADRLITDALERLAWWEGKPVEQMLDWGLDHTPQQITYTPWQCDQRANQIGE